MLVISLIVNAILIILLIGAAKTKNQDEAMIEAAYQHIFGLLQTLEQERMDFRIWKDMYGSTLPDTSDSLNTTDIVE